MKLFWSVVTVVAADTCRCGKHDFNYIVYGSAQWTPCINHGLTTRDWDREVVRSSRHRSKHAFAKTFQLTLEFCRNCNECFNFSDEMGELPGGTCENTIGCYKTYLNNAIQVGCVTDFTDCAGDVSQLLKQEYQSWITSFHSQFYNHRKICDCYILLYIDGKTI